MSEVALAQRDRGGVAACQRTGWWSWSASEKSETASDEGDSKFTVCERRWRVEPVRVVSAAMLDWERGKARRGWARWVSRGHGWRMCGRSACCGCARQPSRGWDSFASHAAQMGSGDLRRLVACFGGSASPKEAEPPSRPAEGRHELVESFQELCGRPPEPKGRPRDAGGSAGCAAERV